MKTSELTDAALDWAVNQIEECCDDPHTPLFSTNWAQGGPIIEREEIAVRRTHEDSGWTASKHVAPATVFEEGPTPLIAAMRCYVASKLGDEIEIPEEFN